MSVLLGNGNGTFKNPVNFATGADPVSVTLGDVNGDGKPDLAVANAGSASVSVLLGNGNGTFNNAVNFGTGSGPRSVALGDVNGDGKPDLAVANLYSASVSVLLGNGNGTFQNPVDFATGAGPYSVALGDVNGDGKPDLAVANQTSASVSVLLNSLQGNFTGQVYTIDQAAPFVQSIARTTPAGPATNATSVVFTATFSEAVTGVDPTDFQLARTGSIGTTLVQVSAISASVYKVTVSGISGNGSLGLNMSDNNSIHDLAGNPLTTTNPPASFAAPANFSTGNAPYAVALGDVNGDGKPDLAVANRYSDSVSVLLGNGNGTFKNAVNFSTGNAPYAVALGDVNGDGKADLAIANQGSDSVSVLLGNGNGTFKNPVNFATGSAPGSVALGDVNGDGKPDLAVANRLSDSISVLLGNGNGTFKNPANFTTGSHPFSVALGDVNGDGKPDLAVANENSASVSVLLGNGNGTFKDPVNFATGSGPISLASGDVNGDGKLDLAVANYFSNSVSVLLGNGNGTFKNAVNFATGSGPISLALGDVNGDGKPDFAVANEGSNSVSVLLGNGNGTFKNPVNFSTGVSPISVAVRDVNGDGKPDLAVANIGSDSVSVLLNSIHGDFTGQVYTIDQTAPTVVSINRKTPSTSLTNASSVVYTVTFSETVTGVDTSDFSLAHTGVTATIASVTGSGSVYTVTVNGISGNGTLGLNLVDNDSIKDQASNPLGGSGANNGNFTGQVYTIDQQGPTVTLSTTVTDPTDVSPIQVTATFNETVTDFALSDLTVANGSASNLTGSGKVYTFDLTPNAPGPVMVSLAADVAHDAAGNGNSPGNLTVNYFLKASVVGSTLQIVGVDSDNDVTIRLKSGDPSHTEILEHNTLVSTLDNSTFSQINVDLRGGNDRLRLDNSNGDPVPVGGLSYDGGSGNDTLAGENGSNSWVVTADNAGTLNSITSFSNVEILAGGSGSDTYNFDTDNSLGSITLDESAGGTDALDFSTTTTQSITVNLSRVTPQVVNSNLTLALSSGNSFENVVGGPLNDSLVGNSLNNILNGQAGNDIYAFDTDNALGNDTIGESSGTDTLTFGATTTKAVAVNLGIATAQMVNSNLTLTLGSTSTIENVVGSSLGDTLTGNSRNNILNGQSGNDTYIFDTDSVLGNDTIAESGVGIDTLSFGATTTKAVTVNLGIATAQVVNSNLTLTLGSASTMEDVVGGSLNDSLAGNLLDNVLNGLAGNDIYAFDTDSPLGNDTISDSSGTDTLSFAATTTQNVAVNLGIATAQVVNSNLTLTLGSDSAIENVLGGSLNDILVSNSRNNILNGLAGNDIYAFDTDNPLGSDTIMESTGIDTLTFAATTTKNVSINLGLATAQAVNSNLALTLGSDSAIENVLGGVLNDILTGNSRDNNLNGLAGNDLLNGQAGNDTYLFNTDNALGSDTINESGVGSDTLDFSATTTKSVTVNLGITTAQVVNSNLTLTLSSDSTMENVIGGSLNDTLMGNSLNNVLSGENGNDSLSGGDGRDILIGGAGADTLSGGNDDDVLLGAVYSNANNVTALNALMSEWGRTDSTTYLQRIDHLMGSNTVDAKNDPFFLTTGSGGTISNDAAIDTETGNAGLDWFFRHSGEDNVTDANGETITPIP